MKYIILLFIPLLAFSFGTGTVKQIDQIDNNTETDILLNPDSKVTVTGLTEGELLYYNAGISSFANGAEGQLLSITAGVLDFIDPPASSPLTTKGDLYTFDSDNQRLPIGSNTQILSANSATATGLEWIAQPTTSPTVSAGDIIYNDGGGAASDTNLAIGSVNQLLTVIAGNPSWQDAPVSTTLTTKGDIQTFTTVNAALTVGSDGQLLSADSAEATGLIWKTYANGSLTNLTKNEFFIEIDATGNIVEDEFGIIDITASPDCAITTTSTYDCDFNSGIFVNTPTIVAGACSNIGRGATVSAHSSTAFTYVTRNFANSNTATSACLAISKSGSDINKAVIAEVTDAVYSPTSGAGLARICSFEINATCTVINTEIGDCIDTIDDSGGTGECIVNFNASYWSSVVCTGSAELGAGTRILTNRALSTTVYEYATTTSAAANADLIAQVICHGVE